MAKANARSRVHRRAYMDYVGVKRFGADGVADGETRFVGLFTAEAYDKAAAQVPLLRRKVGRPPVRLEVEDSIDEETANAIIMAARQHWFEGAAGAAAVCNAGAVGVRLLVSEAAFCCSRCSDCAFC